MRSLATLPILLAACAAPGRSYPFPRVTETVRAERPPDVRWSASLTGVVEEPPNAIATRRYELQLLVEQERGDGTQVWEPIELGYAELCDDEGRRVRAGEVHVATPRAHHPGRSKSEVGGRVTNGYRVCFPMATDYRFESIGRAEVSWKLRSPGRAPVHVITTFYR
ncbi:MAG: hypothetical protein KDC87_07120 [Planctomycetes bacterium]|nr:hypothetical protein [Planctomycetota bacterium]MCB9868383.1 hypothetical protein [Planctomycetota bacterium]